MANHFFTTEIKKQNAKAIREMKKLQALSLTELQERETETQIQWMEKYLEQRLDSICANDLNVFDLLSVAKFCHAMKVQAKYLCGGFDLEKQYEILHKIVTRYGDYSMDLRGSVAYQKEWLKYRHPAVEYHRKAYSEEDLDFKTQLLKVFSKPE